MLQRLQDASVRLKVAAVSAIYVALCVGLGLFSLQQASWINAPAQEIRENWLPAMSKLGHLSQGLSELRLAQYAAGMNLSVDYEKWPANDKAIVAAMDNVKTRFDAVRERAIEGSTEAELMREFATVWGKIEDATKRFREAATGGDIFGAASLIEGETKALMLAAAELVRKDLEYNERGGRVAAQHSASVYGFAFTLISAAICLVTLMGIVTSVLLNRTLVAPLSRATGVVGALTEGRLDIAVSDLERKDEYGMLARALEFFRCSLMKGRQEADAAEVERIRLEAEHKAEQQRAIDAERALVVASIGGGLARLADKDLTFRLNDALPDAYAKLQSDFNHALDQLEGAMQAVSSTSQTITGGTQEVSASTDELSKRTEQQAASLEETAAALDEITATGKKSAEGAEHAREVVTTAKSDAEKTGLVVRRTIEAMGNIEKSAQKISQIIGVIDEIAFQTNLLALNAGVEAARAGEAGRGFAVVASEVRALAQRSAEAAREIKELISTSSSQVSEGVDLVAETGKALERILVQVDDINAVVVNIAAGAKEQAIGLQEVNSAINQMDQTTQQNAAMVEETTAASQSLAAELEQLTALIGQFRVTHAQARNGAVAAVRAKPAPARTSGRPRPLLSKSRSAALPKAQPGTHEEARDDDWTDF